MGEFVASQPDYPRRPGTGCHPKVRNIGGLDWAEGGIRMQIPQAACVMSAVGNAFPWE